MLRFIIFLLLLGGMILPSVDASAQSSEISRVQRHLSDLGYDPGSIDGKWGPSTRAAVQLFVNQHNIDVRSITSGNHLDLKLLDQKLKSALITKKKNAELASIRSSKGIALIIGNAKYKNIKALQNPTKDSALMAATLRAVGFNVTHLTDTNRTEIQNAIRDFSRLLRSTNKPGFFYFSGHAIRNNGQNYLIPVSARIQASQEVELEGVPLNVVLRSMERSSSGVSMVILDTYHANPYSDVFPKAEEGFASIVGPPGTYVSLYTSPDQDGVGSGKEFSPYTWALANAILTPGLQLEAVFKRARIVNAGNFETGSITDEFVFAPLSSKASISSVMEASKSILNPFAKFLGKTFILNFVGVKYPKKFYISNNGSVYVGGTKPSICAQGATGAVGRLGETTKTKWDCYSRQQRRGVSAILVTTVSLNANVLTIKEGNTSSDGYHTITSFYFDGSKCRIIKSPHEWIPHSCEAKDGPH